MAEENTTNEELNEELIGGEATSQETEASTSEVNTDNSSETETAPTHEEQLAAMNDKYLRLYSEFDNYRKRTNKEKLELIATASASVLKDLLTVLDDFDRAIANNATVTDSEAIKEGFNLIHTKLKTTLENKGLKAMTAKGEAFDPEIHEAIANIPAPTEEMKGKVIDDVEAGYYLNDKVIRFAKVVVGN
ncbi:MAG: nucleotide exchange factor GrpE [Moraxellaceae bacterium]|jgi:molecular chaperone GrpE